MRSSAGFEPSDFEAAEFDRVVHQCIVVLGNEVAEFPYADGCVHGYVYADIFVYGCLGQPRQRGRHAPIDQARIVRLGQMQRQGATRLIERPHQDGRTG